MPTVILTLQLPRGSRGIPVATTGDAEVLRFFKEAVLEEWLSKANSAQDQQEAMLARLELERLTHALSVLIPDDPTSG